MSNNNRQKNTQPANVSDGDSSINTKKGFLISLPGKKKNDAGSASSGIVMAKTINGNNSPVHNNYSDMSKDSKQAKSHHSGGKHNKSKKHNGNNNHNNHNSNNKNQTLNNNVPSSADKHTANANAKQEAKASGGDFNRNDKNRRRNDRNDRRHNNKDQNNHNQNQNRQNHKNGHTDNRQNNTKQPDFIGLSPLSRDMRAFEKAKKDDISLSFGKSDFTKELSLEEKYKDAMPLAEQIALEEAKRRVKPKSMQTNKIDRSLTANSEEVGTDGENSGVNSDNKSKQYEVVGIRFREAGKIYYFDPDGKEVPYGTPVIVETARGAEYGYTAISNRLVPYSSVVPPLKKIKRIATEADTQKYVANKSLEADAAKTFKEKVSALGLEMNLVFVEYTFDNSKLLFYFTAETRIDFRELVKELASVFRTRIELRQIGVRDEAKMVGGLGVCGRSVCCNSFLGDFAQVSIKMAKEQGLSLNSAKISGSCGKLMCCLRYEDKVYEEEIARTPKVGSIVETDDGRGIVTESHALKGIVKVTLDASPDSPAKPFNRDAVKVVGFNKAAVKEDAEEMKELKALEDNND